MKKTIYIYKSGTLTRRDNSLCLVEKNKNVHYIPIERKRIINTSSFQPTPGLSS